MNDPKPCCADALAGSLLANHPKPRLSVTRHGLDDSLQLTSLDQCINKLEESIGQNC